MTIGVWRAWLCFTWNADVRWFDFHHVGRSFTLDVGPFGLQGGIADPIPECWHPQTEEVRVVDEDWFGTDEKVGWLRCANCKQTMCEPKVVGDGPIHKEIWEP